MEIVEKMLKKYFKFTYFDRFLFLGYLILILFWFVFKRSPGIAESPELYLSSISYNTNIIPFQFNPLTPINFIIKNLIFKAIVLVPIAYLYIKYWNVNKYTKFISVMMSICIVFNLFLLLTLKGYFDTTDIIVELIGVSIVYIIFSLFKKLTVKPLVSSKT